MNERAVRFVQFREAVTHVLAITEDVLREQMFDVLASNAESYLGVKENDDV